MNKVDNPAKGIIGHRVKLVNGEYVPDIPEDEMDNFFTCNSCGQAVDKRDLGQVFHHEMPCHEPIDFDA